MSEFDPDKQTLEQYDGECNCDPRIGFAPCELCHDRKVIGKLRKENERLRELVEASKEDRKAIDELVDENKRLRSLLWRCKTELGNVDPLSDSHERLVDALYAEVGDELKPASPEGVDK